MSIPICLTFSCKLHILRILLSYKFQDINFGRVKKLSSASFQYQLNIMAERQKKTSKRKPHWSDEELQIMLSCARENREIILGKFSSSVTSEKRKAVCMT